MARIRTIKPEFWRHEALCDLPEATHMLAAALLNYSDDYGYFNANPKLILGEIYPLREPSVSVPESLRGLQTIGYIRLGTGEGGRRYGQIVEFSKHQKVSHPTDSKIALLTIVWDTFEHPPEEFEKSPEPLRPEQGTGNVEQGTGNLSVEANASTGGTAANAVSDRPAWWPTRDRYGRVIGEVTEKIMFDVGKAVLGNSAGGQVTRMRKAYQGDMRAVVDFLLQAEEKSTPSEWFAGCLKRAERDQHDEPKHSIFPMETHH